MAARSVSSEIDTGHEVAIVVLDALHEPKKLIPIRLLVVVIGKKHVKRDNLFEFPRRIVASLAGGKSVSFGSDPLSKTLAGGDVILGLRGRSSTEIAKRMVRLKPLRPRCFRSHAPPYRQQMKVAQNVVYRSKGHFAAVPSLGAMVDQTNKRNCGMLTIEFQAIQTTPTGFSTFSLGAYDDIAVLPLPGMKVSLVLQGADAPYDTAIDVQGTVALMPEIIIYVPNRGLDAMIFLENVVVTR